MVPMTSCTTAEAQIRMRPIGGGFCAREEWKQVDAYQRYNTDADQYAQNDNIDNRFLEAAMTTRTMTAMATLLPPSSFVCLLFTCYKLECNSQLAAA